MLQRIQTLWLLSASACALLTMKFSFFSGNKLGTGAGQVKAFEHLTATGGTILNIFTVTLIVGCLINIFNYKNRKLQLRSTVILTVIALLDIILYYRETQKFIEGNYDLTALLAFAIPVLLILAARGIYKDQKLVKSADRLR